MTNIIRQFLRQEAAGGIILIAAAIVALIMANTPAQGIYQAFLNLPVMVKVASLEIAKPLLLWINDGLMAIFFLVVGLEVKRELMQGSLSGRDKAVFPAIAALGGMLAPALIYLLFNGADEVTRQGWAIPAATDIAFALGVMALLGNRVPTSLKVFLLALAIIDDLGVIIIIALFYTHEVSMVALGVAAAAVALLAVMNWRGVGKTSLYMMVGLVLWVAILKSGVHATLAGVIVGFMIPLNVKRGPSPSETLEHELHPWVAFMILPLFAFANSGRIINATYIEPHHFPVDRLDVCRVGHFRVGHDGRRVGVDQNDAVTLFAQRFTRLGTRVVELTRLADNDRASAEDQDAFYVCTFWHFLLLLIIWR